MTPIDTAIIVSVAIACIADVVAAQLAKRSLRAHRTALAEMREQLKLYDTICQAGGDAEYLFVRHKEGSDSTWIDLVMTIPGLSLRMPIRPEQMDDFLASFHTEIDKKIGPFLPTL